MDHWPDHFCEWRIHYSLRGIVYDVVVNDTVLKGMIDFIYENIGMGQ